MRHVVTTDRIPVKLWLDDIEEGAMSQALDLTRIPSACHWVALMPDAHQGVGMPIGGVLVTRGTVVPNAVGVDIGCGMVAAKTTLQVPDIGMLKQIRRHICAEIPTGFNHHSGPQNWEGFDRAPDLPIIQQELSSARCQIGTLGGGNHFVELQVDEQGALWVMIHSGSRNFGLKVALTYAKVAQEFCARNGIDLPNNDLASLPVDEQEGQDYLTAMGYCLEFARANRDHMMGVALGVIRTLVGGQEVYRVNIHHNYASKEHHYGEDVWVHRKGATSARAGEAGIIPGSMGAFSYIVEGLGNPESFHSCSHGAGRRMGRMAATRNLDLYQEQARMAELGVIHNLRERGDLDEAPGAYKDIDAVMANQTDLVRVVTRLRPLVSIKG